MAANMNDIVDAYSVHIYWDYWNTPFFMEFRLKDVRKIVTEELPAETRKPTYVMEFGVRGVGPFAGQADARVGLLAKTAPTSLGPTSPRSSSCWFDLATVQLGFTGSVEVGRILGEYNASYNSSYCTIGPAAEGWPLFPTYHALRLLLPDDAAGLAGPAGSSMGRTTIGWSVCPTSRRRRSPRMPTMRGI